MATAGETDREASAARMATQHDRTRHAPRAQMRDQIGDVILQLTDVIDIAATRPGEIMPTRVWQDNLGDPSLADRPRQCFIPCPMVGGTVHENQNAIGARFIKTKRERFAIARGISGQNRGVANKRANFERRETKDVPGRVD